MLVVATGERERQIMKQELWGWPPCSVAPAAHTGTLSVIRPSIWELIVKVPWHLSAQRPSVPDNSLFLPTPQLFTVLYISGGQCRLR